MGKSAEFHENWSKKCQKSGQFSHFSVKTATFVSFEHTQPLSRSKSTKMVENGKTERGLRGRQKREKVRNSDFQHFRHFRQKVTFSLGLDRVFGPKTPLHFVQF